MYVHLIVHVHLVVYALIFHFSKQVGIEQGKNLNIKPLAKGDKLTELGQREVFFELNGQLRTMLIKDKEVAKVFTNIHIYQNKTISKVNSSLVTIKTLEMSFPWLLQAHLDVTKN